LNPVAGSKRGPKKFAAALPITQDSAVIEPLAFVTKILVTEMLTKTHSDTVCVVLAILSIPEGLHNIAPGT